MSKPALRCAIYTRVSTDQGLEQDFNSLDAQREAARPISGARRTRAGLIREPLRRRRLFGRLDGAPCAAAAARRHGRAAIDIVVVYKVDRLTRSLADFAKLVELFDAHGVSFVSVTQSFNTTTSMGRLTLNVLLSFAQFEREVTGERIRDKIAASKKKGMWMGGVVPLGYESRTASSSSRKKKQTSSEDLRALSRARFDPGSATELRGEAVVTRERRLANGKIVGAVALPTGRCPTF